MIANEEAAITKMHPGRFTADIDGGFVVFLIGMRINRPWRVTKWLPTFLAMGRMLTRLGSAPELGLLGTRFALTPSPMLIQYWRSFEDLDRFARGPTEPHLEPWRRYVREVGSSGDVGVWHETFRVEPGAYEAIYANMPVSGLAAATGVEHVPVGRRGHSAARRIGVRSTDDIAVPTPDAPTPAAV